jgi:hypothetical protein
MGGEEDCVRMAGRSCSVKKGWSRASSVAPAPIWQARVLPRGGVPSLTEACSAATADRGGDPPLAGACVAAAQGAPPRGVLLTSQGWERCATLKVLSDG